MKNLLFIKQSIWMILSILLVVAMYFFALGLGWGADNQTAAAVAAAVVTATVAVTAVVVTAIATVAVTAATATAFVAFVALAIVAAAAFAVAGVVSATTTAFISTVTVAAVATDQNGNISFWKIFLLMVVFLMLTGFGLYFVFISQFLPGFVLVGTGILFLVILNVLDIIVQLFRGKSIFAKLAKVPKEER